MASGIFNIGLTALSALQRSLDVTAHNIANANTPGYSRQSVHLAAIPGPVGPAGAIGHGVAIDQVRRSFDQFAFAELTRSSAMLGSNQVLADLSGSLDRLLGPDGLDPSSALQNFFAGLEDVANDPTSLSARTDALGRAQSMVNRMQVMDEQFEALRTEANGRIRASVTDINERLDTVADLNRRITEQRTMGPNHDLLDQRDSALRALSEQLDIAVIHTGDGGVNVVTPRGQALVTGSRAQHLAVSPSSFDASTLEVGLQTAGGILPMASEIQSGALGGAMRFVSEVLDPAQAALGRQAHGLVLAVNAQHSRGVDLAGQQGQDLLTIAQPEVLPAPGNTANSVSAQVIDAGQVGSGDYRLDFDGAAWQLFDLATGQAMPLVPNGGALEGGGLSITPDPAAVAGDSFVIRPARGAAGSLNVAIGDPAALAAASALRATEAGANLGTGAAGAPNITDPTDPALLNAAQITFDTPTSYRIDGGAPQAWAPGDTIAANGWELTLSGTPAAGDRFDVVANNTGEVGNGDNALSLAALGRQQVLGNQSLNEAMAGVITDVGVQARGFDTARSVQAGLVDGLEARMAQTSGVNLDEEAVKLQQLQQAYGAAAEIFVVADEMFQTLLNSVRR